MVSVVRFKGKETIETSCDSGNRRRDRRNTSTPSRAEITFLLPPERNHDQFCTVFWCDAWRGDPRESEEVRPQWFSLECLPYDEMWESDRHWLPEVIAGKQLEAIVDATNDGTMNYSAQYVDHLD